MSGRVAELKNMLEPDGLVKAIIGQYIKFRNFQAPWRAEKLELRNYLFATDTKTTSNAELPWMNSTTLPKLCQIRDNLHANYMSALFPKDKWFKWEAHSADAAIKAKANLIEDYMDNKLRMSNFKTTVSQLVYDYIDYGNAFADAIYVNEARVDPITGEQAGGYVGPKATRISPMDIIINPIAAAFDLTPKMTRKIVTLGELKKIVDEAPDNTWAIEAIAKMDDIRNRTSGYTAMDFEKAEAYSVDGFGSLRAYYQSGYVEIIEFEGTAYDADTGAFFDNVVITIADRMFVLQNVPNPSWAPHGTKVHAGWRFRPDNLLAMGPLDNLVGMQYRVDHLENAKADAIDQNIIPPIKVIGEVEDFQWGPGETIVIDEGGDVQPMRPDLTVLNLNQDILNLTQTMEKFAGAPSETMGIRSPGEKTAFEVQQLTTAASRIFQEKLDNFELNVLDPLLNNMLELARRNITGVEDIASFDDQSGVKEFLSITKEDLVSNGKLRPTGAKHFVAQAQLMQSLLGIANSPLIQIITPHLSSIRLANLVEEVMGLRKFDLFQENVAIEERAEQQRLANQASEDVGTEQATPIDDPSATGLDPNATNATPQQGAHP